MARRSKRGSLADISFMVVILIVLSIVILITFKVSDEINTKIQTSDIIGDMEGGDRARTAMNQVNNLYPGIVDNSFLFLAVGISIAALVLAMLVRVHPVFLVFFILMWFIVIWITGVFANIYIEMANTAALQSVADQLIFTSHIMQYLPFIVGVIGGLLAIVMYKSYSAEQ